jgi:hypothetical protein
MRWLATVGLALLLGRQAQSDNPQAPFQVTTRKPEDRVRVQHAGDQVVFTIESPSGIGGARITRGIERWPTAVVLRLRLRGLERLQTSNGTVTLVASVASNAEHATTLALAQSDQTEVRIERGSPYWTEIRILDAHDRPTRDLPLKDGVFEVTLPPAFFASNPPGLSLDWIDFYR